MERNLESRRTFLKNASIAFALPLILSCEGDTAAQKTTSDRLSLIKENAVMEPNCDWCGARDAPADVSWKTALAGESDQGDKMVISGTIFNADGTSPADGVLIYLYHTDVHGIYGRGSEHRHGRYRGWMLTDAKGKYEFASIIPAPYPNSTISKHVHMTLTTKDRKEDWIDSILFEGDRFLTDNERVVRKGGFDPVVKLERLRSGVMSGVRNIRLG